MQGYAVIDCETTGLNKMNNDKIIEIAIVHLDLDLNITGTYETLLNPKRDVGLVSLHGINGLMASQAPIFTDIMESLAYLLNDRVIIAHNANFDTKFIEQAYDSENIAAGLGDYLDTLSIAKRGPGRFSSYSLEYLCAHYKIPIVDAHTAMGDALATAKLFILMVNKWGFPTVRHSPTAFYDLGSGNNFKLNSDRSNWKTRQSIIELISDSVTLERFMQTLQKIDEEMSEETITTYLSTLHKTLLNNSYTVWEREKMEEMIIQLSLSHQQVLDLNEEYIFMLICKHLILNRGEPFSLTENDKIANVAKFTGVSEFRAQQLISETLANSHLIEPTDNKLKSYFQLEKGDHYVTTGEDLVRSNHCYGDDLLPLEIYLHIVGYIPKSSVTKSTKAVICYDPYSLSNKAIKAREYGIPILTEETVISLLNLK